MLMFRGERGAAQLADLTRSTFPGKLTQHGKGAVIAGGRRKRRPHTALRKTSENGGATSLRSDVDSWVRSDVDSWQ